MPPHPHPDAIADTVLAAFAALPPKCKPRALPNARREWVPVAGFVLSKRSTKDSGNSPTPQRLKCAALATGMKCLTRARVATAHGRVLHDSHAEVLAKRAFGRWLLDQCAALATETREGGRGEWVRWRTRGEREGAGAARGGGQPFTLREDVDVHFYASEAPCGDASMELVMAEVGDATPWSQMPRQGRGSPGSGTAVIGGEADGDSAMLGRGHFDRLGQVRRKPSRADAPVSWSKSCSDKMALWQCVGLLSALVAKVVWPGNVYLTTIVLPEGRLSREGCERAFGTGENGRMAPVVRTEGVQERWAEVGYGFRGFEVVATGRSFGYGKEEGGRAVASNLSAVRVEGRSEAVIGGVLQGRKQGDSRAASSISRAKLWAATLEVAQLSGEGALVDSLSNGTYGEVKEDEGRSVVKSEARDLALKSWKRNIGDEDWTLDDEF